MLSSLGTDSYFNISLGSIVIVSHALIGPEGSTFKGPRTQSVFYSPPWEQKGWQIQSQTEGVISKNSNGLYGIMKAKGSYSRKVS